MYSRAGTSADRVFGLAMVFLALAVVVFAVGGCGKHADLTGPAKKYTATSLAEHADAYLVQTVGRVGTSSGYPSTAIDVEGRPHIAYQDESGYLMLASGIAGGGHGTPRHLPVAGWSSEVVDQDGRVGAYASLVFGPNGRTSIAYFDADRGDLKLAVKDGAGWAIERVDEEGTVGAYASMVIDAAGAEHIAYLDQTNDRIKVATRTGATWSYKTFGHVGGGAPWISLVLDSRGRAHMAYIQSNRIMRFATENGASWTVQTVEANGHNLSGGQLFFDADGRARISYIDRTWNTVALAAKSGVSWAIEHVGESMVASGRAAMTGDAAGRMCFGYYDDTHGLICAARITNGWEPYAVSAEPFGTGGGWTSMAMDATGHTHMAYGDRSQGLLTYVYDTEAHAVPGADTLPSPGGSGGNGNPRRDAP